MKTLLTALAVALCTATLTPSTAWAQHRHDAHGGRGGSARYYPGGIWVLPAMATVLTVGAVTYWYANGLYYRARPVGGYEVVPPPEDAVPPPVSNGERLYIYPRKGQSAEKQASDEYECHKWAARQSGFDPMAEFDGSRSDPAHKSEYLRAQTACLEGRGYTVR